MREGDEERPNYTERPEEEEEARERKRRGELRIIARIHIPDPFIWWI